ncbi:MAG: hypothetical protein LH654_04935 [Thermoleophilia bacterium]|nr:hypothetical protein [Thermoleophilia bacterium]
MSGEERGKRAARNEDLFRQVNERLHDLAVISGSSEPHGKFVCECEQTSCSLLVELSAGEYGAVRANDTRFLVFPEPWHTSPEVEAVVERHDRYWVVEKRGTAGAEAEDLAERGSNLL